jgi:choline monooxygenase
VATWGPFVFVNPDLDAEPLLDYLGDLPQLIAEGGIDLEGLQFRNRVEVEYAANWKICVENYLECYHCSVAHPSFSKAIDVAPDAYLLETRRWIASQYGEPRDQGGGVYDAAGEVARGQFHLLFPNTPINVMPGRPNLSIGPVIPIGPETTYRFLDYFFAPDVDEDWIDDYIDLDNQVGTEDRALVERVQQGVRSGGLDHGVLMPESERLIAYFQALVTEALGQP